MKHKHPLFLAAAHFSLALLVFDISFSAIASAAPVAMSEAPAQAENIGAVNQLALQGHSLAVRMDNSAVAKKTIKRYGKEINRAEGVVQRWSDGSELAIIPYVGPRRPEKIDGAAWLIFGVLPSGEDFAINLELEKKTGNVSYTDATGAGVKVKLEIKGDKFRFKESSQIDKEMGFLDKSYKVLGIGSAEAFSWYCWAKCVPQFCPTWSYCWWSCGWACGGCLAACIATFGWGCAFGCAGCVGCLGHIAYVCASRC